MPLPFRPTLDPLLGLLPLEGGAGKWLSCRDTGYVVNDKMVAYRREKSPLVTELSTALTLGSELKRDLMLGAGAPPSGSSVSEF